MELNTFCTLGDIIRILRKQYLEQDGNAFYNSENWFIYTAGEEAEFRLDTPCAIAARPDHDDERGLEILPAIVDEHRLYGELMPETLEGVIASALDQKRNASEEELLRALNYYAEQDGFLPF